MAPRFKPYRKDYCQSRLFATNVFDLLPEDHECFLYQELFEQLDTSEVEAQYSDRGQRAYPPRQIVSILIYAYSRGVFSSRQIEQRCRENLGFMYIAGRNCPNFRVLSDFRKDHGGFFRSCFKQTVQLALALGLVSLGHVSLDGSKFKANSSKHKAMSYGRLKEKEQELCEEIEALTRQADRCDEEEDRVYQERTGYELPDDLRDKKQRLKKVREMKQLLEAREQELRPGQAIEDKKQISFADPEARIMKQIGDFEYAYNAQISVDGKSQVIVGQHVSQQANDAQEVAPAWDEVEETSGRLPEKLSLDNGYYSGKNLQETSDRKLEAYIATDRGEKRGKGDLDASERHLVKAGKSGIDWLYGRVAAWTESPAPLADVQLDLPAHPIHAGVCQGLWRRLHHSPDRPSADGIFQRPGSHQASFHRRPRTPAGRAGPKEDFQTARGPQLDTAARRCSTPARAKAAPAAVSRRAPPALRRHHV